MIKSFCCFETAKIFRGERSLKFPQEIQQKALDKLIMLTSAGKLEDLCIPPGNRLEKLRGNKNYYSIRINQQWRICFYWEDLNAYQVEIIDYH